MKGGDADHDRSYDDNAGIANGGEGASERSLQAHEITAHNTD